MSQVRDVLRKIQYTNIFPGPLPNSRKKEIRNLNLSITAQKTPIKKY